MTKRKHETEARTHTSHLPSLLVKLHGDRVLLKLHADIQELVKSVAWKEGVLLHPKEANTDKVSTN